MIFRSYRASYQVSVRVSRESIENFTVSKIVSVQKSQSVTGKVESDRARCILLFVKIEFIRFSSKLIGVTRNIGFSVLKNA